jgi:hypothetical protein
LESIVKGGQISGTDKKIIELEAKPGESQKQCLEKCIATLIVVLIRKQEGA